jgi:hypothetical protein
MCGTFDEPAVALGRAMHRHLSRQRRGLCVSSSYPHHSAPVSCNRRGRLHRQRAASAPLYVKAVLLTPVTPPQLATPGTR